MNKFSLVNTEVTNQKCLIKLHLCTKIITGVLLSMKNIELFQKYCPPVHLGGL